MVDIILIILSVPYLSGVRVTKALIINFYISKLFDCRKVPLRLFVSYSYLKQSHDGSSGSHKTLTRQTHDIIMSLLCQNDITTSFWPKNYVISALCVDWEHTLIKSSSTKTQTKCKKRRLPHCSNRYESLMGIPKTDLCHTTQSITNMHNMLLPFWFKRIYTKRQSSPLMYHHFTLSHCQPSSYANVHKPASMMTPWFPWYRNNGTTKLEDITLVWPDGIPRHRGTDLHQVYQSWCGISLEGNM